jgi:hypothetical protein
MKNGTNVVGDIGCGSYEMTWNNRFEESEIYNSYSHPVPVIGKLCLKSIIRIFLLNY